ncbi:MAG TPA: hypothetical protein VKU94_04880 [Geobacterales bacterium]|nr:hypothetical protein [Geobacterales bacterium]
MPRPSLRNEKRHVLKAPSGRIVIHYEKEKRNRDKCALCKSELRGVYHGFGSMSKTSRIVKRAYGGYLCHKCLQKIIEERVISQLRL